MKILVLIVALVLGQARAPQLRNVVDQWLKRWVARVHNALDSEDRGEAWLALLVSVGAPLAASFFFGLILNALSGKLNWVWGFVLFYLSSSFRRFSLPVQAIVNALRVGNIAEAREQLTTWLPDNRAQSVDDIARTTYREGVKQVFSLVFAPVFWFWVLPINLSGAWLYYLLRIAAAHPAHVASLDESAQLPTPAQTLLTWMDWIPLRLTGLAFAVAGNFDNAQHAWRDAPQQDELLVVIASGALGRPDNFTQPPLVDVATLSQAIRLVIRSLLVWLVCLLLLKFGKLV